VAAQIRRAADTATARHRELLVEAFQNAVAAYERGRFPEAARLAGRVSNEVPGVAVVREVAGLGSYRAGRWRDAVRHLRAHRELTEDVEHIPAMMDCQRAMGHPRRVADLWGELRRSSPGSEVLSEGRIVAAATLADQGDLQGGIALLEGGGAAKAVRNPSDRHLRQWYSLGDLYERAGDLPRAREFFTRVVHADPDAYDVLGRLESLGPARPRATARRRAKPARSTGSSQPPA
jgi:tetratricopeptide (TPR) repeat protein